MAVTKYQQEQDTIIDDLIKQLLGKEQDEELDIELYGYPADYLDDPKTKHSKPLSERYNALIDGNDYIGFKICSVINGDFRLGSIFYYTQPLLLLDFGLKKAYINTKKLKSLLYDQVDAAVIKTSHQGDALYVKLNKRLLLDSIT